MKFFTKSTLLMVGAGFLMTPAFAANVSQNSIYISGDAGWGLLATPNDYLFDKDTVTAGLIINGQSFERGSFAGGANIGYNRALSQNVLVGAEFGYDYNGQSKYTITYNDGISANDVTTKFKITSQDLHLLATATYLLNNGINVFGKAGVARVDQKFDVSGAHSNDSNDKATEYQPMIAAGIGYQYKMANLFVQYSHIFAKDATDNANDLFDSKGNLEVVTVDTVKAGIAFNISI